MPKYFGTYADFECASKDMAGVLIGADNMIGDVYDIGIELKDGVYTAWLDNRFDQRVGYFDKEMSRKLSLLAADGLIEKAILSFVAFSESGEEGHYWGQAAIICFSPAFDQEFDNFVANVSKKIGDDVRPRVDFDTEAIDRIIESNGVWMPTQTVSIPSGDKKMAIIKRRRKASDKLIEQGRAGNKGCYVVSWLFILAIVALLVYGFKSLLGW